MTELVMTTRETLEYCDHREWREHYFGLSPERWEALAGKVVWVTGAGSGFGRAIAVMLAAAQAVPVLTGRKRDSLEDTLDTMRELGIDPRHALIRPADITDLAAVEQTVADIERTAGSLQGLLGCAALPQQGGGNWPLTEMSPEAWHDMMATNVTAQWFCARAAMPLMARSREARMLFLTSEAGWAFTPGVGPYNVTKAALNSLGASLAAELAAKHPDGDVQINVLNPGEARTGMNQGSDVSPYTVVSMALALLSHPRGGPNGRFFVRDGRHLAYAYAEPWPHSLFGPPADRPAVKKRWPFSLGSRN